MAKFGSGTAELDESTLRGIRHGQWEVSRRARGSRWGSELEKNQLADHV